MKPLDPRLLRHARATRGFLAVCVVLGAAQAGLLVAQATLLANGIANAIALAIAIAGAGAGAGAGAALGPTVVWLAAVVAARALVSWAHEVAAARASASVKSQLRARLLERLTQLPPGRTGELTTLAVRGLDALDAYFARYLPQLVLAGLVPAIVLLRIVPADLVAGTTIVLTLPLIPVFMALVGMHTESANRRQFRLLARLSHHFLDVVAGLPTLKAFGRAKAQAEVVGRVSAEQRRVTMRTLRVAFLSSLVLELLATLSVALVAVGIGLRLVAGQLDLATALLVLILAPEAYLPLRQVGANYHASAEGLAAAEQIFAVLEEPPPASGSTPPPAGELRFEDVTVRYPGRDAPALDRVSFEVRPGEVVALTGPSGAGKSTAIAVLLGFVTPDSGRLTVAGTALSDVDLEAWRRNIAWVPQRPYLFAGTIAENIRLGDPAATDEAVREAARRAGALPFLDALPDGLDTVLADDGTGLSAGQRQRVALARAFLRDAPLVLLDEPTANLDEGTERGILDAIRRLAEGRTVVLAAHRPALLAVADRSIGVAA